MRWVAGHVAWKTGRGRSILVCFDRRFRPIRLAQPGWFSAIPLSNGKTS